MNFLRCHVMGFGKLADFSACFHNGLNVVFAPNEGGKSTLQRFLLGLLYGQLRADLKNQRRLDPWVEQYKPWHASKYGGTLWCRLENGRELEVFRTFGKDETRIEIRTTTGENIVDSYEQQRNGEVVFARNHLGLPKDLFESVAVIRENRVAELNGRDSIRDRIANLAQSGDEELSVRQSIDRLQEAIELIGSERAPTRPYTQTLDLVQTLQEEKKALESRRIEFQSWVDERNRLAAEANRLEGELSVVKCAVAHALWREASHKVRVMEEIEAELGQLRAELESVAGDPSFPVHRLEELDQLSGAREGLEQRLTEVRLEIEEALGRLRRAEAERRKLADYESVSASPEAEKITEWFVNYLGLSLQKDHAQKSLNNLRGEQDSLQRALQAFGPVLSSSEEDWERKARETSDAERDSSQKTAVLLEKISQEKTVLAQIGASRKNRCILGGIAVFVTAFPWILGVLPIPVQIPPPLGLVLSVIFAALAAYVFHGASKLRVLQLQTEQRLKDYTAQQTVLQEQIRKVQEEMRRAITGSGFETLGDFLEAAKRSRQIRQDIVHLTARVAEDEQRLTRVQAEAAKVYTSLKDSLAKTGLSCSPANLRSQIDVLRANLRNFRETDAQYRGFVQNVEALRAKEAQLGREAEQKDSSILEILVSAGVDSPQAFREGCRKRQRTLELAEREAARKREFQRLCEDRTLDYWKEKVAELEEKYRRASQESSRDQAPSQIMGEGGERAPLLPYLPSAAEAEAEEKRISSLLASVREEHARLVERVNQAFRNFRTFSEIEEDLGVAEQELRNLTLNRKALELALETITALSREQQEVLAPQLNRAVEDRLIRLCRGRYEEVRIDPDFQIWVREKATGELRLAEQLSRGTQDQLYFSLRFGILDLISNEAEPCPCLLDEPFAAYDALRMAEAFNILRDEARHRQLVLFTCREDLLKLACQQDAHVLELYATP